MKWPWGKPASRTVYRQVRDCSAELLYHHPRHGDTFMEMHVEGYAYADWFGKCVHVVHGYESLAERLSESAQNGVMAVRYADKRECLIPYSAFQGATFTEKVRRIEVIVPASWKGVEDES